MAQKSNPLCVWLSCTFMSQCCSHARGPLHKWESDLISPEMPLTFQYIDELDLQEVYNKNQPPGPTNFTRQPEDDCTCYRLKHKFATEEIWWLFMTLNHKFGSRFQLLLCWGARWQVLDCSSLLTVRMITSLGLWHSSPPSAGNCCTGPLRVATHTPSLEYLHLSHWWRI